SDQSPASPRRFLVGDSLTLELGGKTIRVLHMGRAHTGGDLLVHVPEDGVLFMSEVYFYRLFPSMRTAYPSEWLQVIEDAQQMAVEMYVPGHGFVESPEILEEELEMYRRAMETVITEGRRL